MGLENFWFVLIAVLWAGYFLLEGFDFGVGMLLPVLPRDERERGMMFESIGPVWDGNEVWLVVAGGATFAAFPAWYATMFSGFYIALLLILVLLIVRVVSFEWREKRDEPALAGHLAVGEHDRQRRRPVPVGRGAGEPLARRAAGLLARVRRRLLRPVQRLHGRRGPRGGGVFAVHGATYLTLRTAGDFCARAAAVARRLSLPAAILGIAHRRLDRRRRPRSQQPGHPPDGGPRRADRDRADPRRRAHARAPQRLGLRGDRARRDRRSSRRSSPACIRACSSRIRRSPTASRSPMRPPGTTRSR